MQHGGRQVIVRGPGPGGGYYADPLHSVRHPKARVIAPNASTSHPSPEVLDTSYGYRGNSREEGRSYDLVTATADALSMKTIRTDLHRAARRIRTRVIPGLRYLGSSDWRRCGCCERKTIVVALSSGDEFRRCIRCGASLRYELLAQWIRANVPWPADAVVLELDPDSPLRPCSPAQRSHTHLLRRSPGAPRRRAGAVNEDIQALSLPDASIDLIVSSEVLEHVPDLDAAFAETYRVLRPGGAHVFTVPRVDGRCAGRNSFPMAPSSSWWPPNTTPTPSASRASFATGISASSTEGSVLVGRDFRSKSALAPSAVTAESSGLPIASSAKGRRPFDAPAPSFSRLGISAINSSRQLDRRRWQPSPGDATAPGRRPVDGLLAATGRRRHPVAKQATSSTIHFLRQRTRR